MTDHGSKRPSPVVMDVGTFQQRFGTVRGCWEHLRDTHWGPNLERFVCPDCGHGEGWWLANRRLVECRACYRLTSVTAGTACHSARVPPCAGFLAIFQLAQCKQGTTALTIAEHLGPCYGLAFGAEDAPSDAASCGCCVVQGLVEADEAYVGGELPGHPSRPGRDSQRKVPVVVALDLDPPGKRRYVAMASVNRVSEHRLKCFAAKIIVQGSQLRTDGWGTFCTVTEAVHEHGSIITGSCCRAVLNLLWIHTFIGNIKRMVSGTYHRMSPRSIDGCTADFTYRPNRR